MSERLLTLREIPQPSRSVLFDDDGGGSPHVLPVTFDIRTITPHLCDFGVVPTPGVALEESAVNSGRTSLLDEPGAPRTKRARTFDARAQTGAVSHSAERLANAIVLATKSPRDLRTLTAWGKSVGVSRGALRVWCKAAGVSARSSLDFLRVLRAILHSETQPWDLLSTLDVVDQRSVVQLLNRGGVRKLCQHKRPTVDEFLVTQTFLKDDRLRHAISMALRPNGERQGPAPRSR